MSPAAARDAYYAALADHADCQARMAQRPARASRYELQQHERRLRALRSMIPNLDTVAPIPGSKEEREERIWRELAGMG